MGDVTAWPGVLQGTSMPLCMLMII
jgi:hypothetical protein